MKETAKRLGTRSSVVIGVTVALIGLYYGYSRWSKSRTVPKVKPDKIRKRKKTNTEVADIIESRTCRIIASENETSGYLYDIEQGIILTSFHLFDLLATAYIEPICAPTGDTRLRLIKIMQANGYIDTRGYLTPKIASIKTLEDINLEIKEDIVFEYYQGPVNGPPERSVIPIIRPGDEVTTQKSLAYEIIQNKLIQQSLLLSEKDIIINVPSFLFPFSGKIYFPENLSNEQKESQLYRYAHLDILPIKITDPAEITLIKQSYQEKKLEILSLKDYKHALAKGNKIYMGGYPLAQSNFTFGTGLIASLDSDLSKQSIVIEAQVSPGSSGSPIFIQFEGKLYFIGLIASAVANVSDNFLHIRQLLSRVDDEYFQGLPSQNTIFREIIEMQCRNFSTGRGRVILCSDLSELNKISVIPQSVTQQITKRIAFDLLVPKKSLEKLEKKEKPLIHWHQFLNNLFNKNSESVEHLRLNIESLFEYIKQFDIKSCKTIYQYLPKKAKNPEEYEGVHLIFEHKNFPLKKDIEPTRVNQGGPLYNRPSLTYLHVCAYLLSQGHIYQGAFFAIIPPDAKQYQNSWFTEDFIERHVVAGNNKQAQSQSISTAAKRKKEEEIKVSTVLGKNSLNRFKDEVGKLQPFYHFAGQCVLKKLCSNPDYFQKGIWFVGLYIRTQAKYRLFESNEGTLTQKPDSTFYYSVVPNPNGFLVNHYESDSQKPDWELLDAKDSPEKVEAYIARL